MADNGWATIAIDAIAAPIPTALATGPFGSAISSKYFVAQGVPVIRGSNLSQDVGTRLNDHGLVFVSVEQAKKYKRSIARRGDLVFTCWGTIDQIGLIDERSQYSEYVVSNKQMKLTPDSSKVDSLFLYYCLSTPGMRSCILNQGIGSSVPGFNLGQLRALQVSLPSLSIQRRIADILGTLDDNIELNRQMNETLEAMAQRLFKSWFIDCDPVHAKAALRREYPKLSNADLTRRALPNMAPEIAELFPDSFEDSTLGPIPKGWHAGNVPDAIEINPTRSLAKGTVAPWLEMSNMPTRSARAIAWEYREFGSGTKFINGDTLVARITPCLENGKTAFVDFLEGNEVGAGSTEYIVLRPKSPLPPVFAYLLARTDDFRQHLITNMTGTSGRQRAPADCLNTFPLITPPKEIADCFGHTTNNLFAQLKVIDEESLSLTAIRDRLLPRLLSGEIEVTGAGESHEST